MIPRGKHVWKRDQNTLHIKGENMITNVRVFNGNTKA